MSDLITTKPGDKYASIRNPRMYRALRRRGYSKEQAAKITNARSKSVDDLERAVEAGQPQYLIDAIAAQCDELPRFKGEQIAPGITRIRGNLCNVHGRYGRCPGAAVSAPKPPPAKPKKGGRARKPAKPKKTDAERQAEQDAKREAADAEKRATRDRLLTEAGIDKNTQGALVDARDGNTLTSANGAKLAQMGLAEQAADGSYRLTAAGRGVVDAALRGDAGKVSDTMSAARDAAAKRNAAKPEKAPKGGGGGGGKGPKEKPSEDEKRQAQTQERQQRASETAAKVGLGADNADALRQAAETGGVDNTALRQLGFIDADGMATDQGRRALSALERGDVRAYNAAVQDARSRLAREQAAAGRRTETERRRTEAERTRQQRQAETERRRAEADRRQAQRDAERAKRDEERRTEPERRRAARRARREAARNETRMQKSFTVFKDAAGRDRWLSVTTTAYQDRDREWISRKAIVGAVAQGDATGQRGPLRFWHVPGLDLGTCDYQATAQDGRFLIESGTFKNAVAARIGQAAAARGYQMSPGFVHPANEPRGGVFDHITIFERSMVPAGRASNPFTRLVTKGTRMLTDEKKKEFEALAGDAESRQFLSDLLSTVQTTDKAAQESATYKDAPDWAQALIGRIDALEKVALKEMGDSYMRDLQTKLNASVKAASPPVEEQPVADLEVEEKIDGEEMAPMEEEPTGGLTLSPEDLTAITEVFTTAIQSALAPVVGMLDIEKKVAGHVQSMLAPYQTQKDAADAERAKEITDLQATLKATQDKLAELLGETPRAYHRITDNPVVSEARKEQLVPPTQTDFDPIVTQLMGNGVHLPGN